MASRIAEPYEADNAFPGGGTYAYRPTGWFPQIAPEGALWPPKPTWCYRAWMFIVEYWLRAWQEAYRANDIRAQRTLWKRHPWMFVGQVWWRPWRHAASRRYELIDPSSGLHRMDVRPVDEDFVFDFEQYGMLVGLRGWRFPWPR